VHTLGIDFGSKGGLTLLEGNQIIMKTAMPYKDGKTDIPKLLSFCTDIMSEVDLSNLKIYGEKLHAIFGSSAKATFSFGKVYGETIGVIESVLGEIELVRAVDWQKEIFKAYEIKEVKKNNSNRRDTKTMALHAALTVWPNEDWRASSRHRIVHDGIIDSALIALYGSKR
tara:strand:- start:15319 stop:15828 length:510 start_codon:yes stop_codon:yes gene_type:complete